MAAAATGACVLASAPASTPPAGLTVEHVGTYVWHHPAEDFGGFSAIEMSADGSRYTALSDRATLRWGSVTRDTPYWVARVRSAGSRGPGPNAPCRRASLSWR